VHFAFGKNAPVVGRVFSAASRLKGRGDPRRVSALLYAMKPAVAFLVLISWAAGASSDGWDHGSSIPVRAAIEPAVADLTPPLPPGDVVIGGLLGERVRAHTSGRVSNIDEEVLLAGFRQRPGSHPWIGEHVGKWLHAASLLWLHSSEPELREKLTRVGTGLMATQGADGYLGTYLPEKRLGLYPGAAWDGKSWHDSDWDVWVHKYALIGLLSYHGISGDESALTGVPPRGGSPGIAVSARTKHPDRGNARGDGADLGARADGVALSRDG
jgi:hypothetical protein